MSPAEIFLIAAAATGVWLIVQGIPTPMAPSLYERVAPYLGREESIWQAGPTEHRASTWLPRWILSLAEEAAQRVSWMTGGDGSAQRRLDALGPSFSVEQFRLEQLGWGFASALCTGMLLLVRGEPAESWPIGVLILGIAMAVGVLARDHALTRAVQRRKERMQSELPTIVEMLAMAVGAGSSLTGALERVSQVGQGVVAAELTRVLDDTRVGLPLVPSLQQLATRNELNEVTRFVDAVVVAVERGTPLAHVLAAQAADAREASRRALIEAGGRKEIAMMVPVVFLVLPLSVLFVLFPGFYGLSLGS
ncbi:MAG: type II secretion system F family protein [Actinomycetia bacterium]|nr:type II secretion system F family protein [Actinomycetes bacterium]